MVNDTKINILCGASWIEIFNKFHFEKKCLHGTNPNALKRSTIKISLGSHFHRDKDAFTFTIKNFIEVNG